jgi:hypothetical protein
MKKYRKHKTREKSSYNTSPGISSTPGVLKFFPSWIFFRFRFKNPSACLNIDGFYWSVPFFPGSALMPIIVMSSSWLEE